jgi:uncharacterized protein YijF (DUF1287 family)
MVIFDAGQTAVVTAALVPYGRPLVIQNIVRETQAEDVLFAHRVTGRFAWV